MFSITHDPINAEWLKEQIKTKASGAISVFEGIVRDHHQGREVKALEYEAMESLAKKEALEIIEEAKVKFNIHHILSVHRAGRLEIGDIAILIGVTAAHRDDAFKACRYVIDEIKKRLPIWKKEFYVEGESQWVNCSYVHDHKHKSESEIYSRQRILSDIGEEGQQKLKAARVLIVGAGGLGSSVLPYLTSAGVGTLGICEFDQLEISNLNRQTLYSYQDVGQPKVQLAAKRVEELNPFINIIQHPAKLEAGNIESIGSQYDVIVDCTDDITTKFLLNDFAVIYKIPLVQSSIFQYQGQIQLIHPELDTACMRCLWETIPDPDCIGTCDQAGVLGFVPGFFGALQAAEVINVILHKPDELLKETVLFDFKTYELTKLRSQKNSLCPVCSSDSTITGIVRQNYERTKNSEELDINQLSIGEFLQYKLIDLREEEEREAKLLECDNLTHVPLNKLSKDKISKVHKYLFFCVKGARSLKVVKQLREAGLDNVFSAGGADTISSFLENTLMEKGKVK